MDSFNKVISFVLGLVVVLVFLAVITGKLNLKSKPFGGSSPTSTPTPTQKPSPTNVYNQTSISTAPKSIPATGLPTLFIPMLLAGLVGGGFLRKSGKK
ncbi:hypothetical protein HZA75_08030 [Candidatus Roizmanbacteria bacterium]|nr:hypothetical protein [Candidatus Roizmanbacteria bacterium]